MSLQISISSHDYHSFMTKELVHMPQQITHHHLLFCTYENVHIRSSPPEVLLGIGVPNICNKFIEEHQCRSMISLRHGCSLVNLSHTFSTPFPENTFEGLLLSYSSSNFSPSSLKTLATFEANKKSHWL